MGWNQNRPIQEKEIEMRKLLLLYLFWIYLARPTLLRREVQIRGEATKETAQIQKKIQFIIYIISQLTPKTQSIYFKLTGAI